MFQVVAVSPKGQRITIGLGQRRLQHALEDRDDLRDAYLRKGTEWTVIVEDPDGAVKHWADAEADVAAGDPA